MRRCLCVLVIALSPVVASAQGGSNARFVTGPVSWTPTLSLRDVGTDSNIFNEPLAIEDRTATLTPQIDVRIDAPHAELSGSAVVDLVYFERTTSERAMNRRVNLRADLPFSRLVPFVTVGYNRTKERRGPEIDVRARREEQTASVGAALNLTTRGTLTFAARLADLTFDQGQTFRGIELLRELDTRTEGFSGNFRYAVTPITSFQVDVLRFDERYANPLKDTENVRALVGVLFAPDAVIRGGFSVGLHRLAAKDPRVTSYTGLTWAGDLSVTLLGRTRLDGRYSREATVSVEAPYYIRDQYGLDVQQTLIGPLAVLLRGGRETLDYPGFLELDVPPRIEYVDSYGGGLSIQITQGLRTTLNYEFGERRTPIDAGRYERRRLYSSVFFRF